jgi:hypothetical protein
MNQKRYDFLGYKLSLTTMVRLLVALCVFTFSLQIDPFYTGGDIALYKDVYTVIAELNLTDSYMYYSKNLDAREFVHFFLSWLGSHLGIDRALLNAFASAILAYVAMVLFKELKASIFIATIIVLTNVYFILLYTTTERLKICMVFFCLSILYRKNQKRAYFFAFLAVISHVQIIILYSGMMLYKSSIGLKRLLLNGLISKKFIPIALLISILVVFVADQVLIKFNYYYSHNIFTLTDLVKTLALTAMTLWYSRNKTETIFVFIPIVLAVVFLGGGRLNIFGYFIFLYYALPRNGGFNFGVLSTAAYFLYVSVFFISGIVDLGYPPY